MAVRNEFDIKFEETCPVENSSIVSEKGPETNNACGHQDKNVKNIFSSQIVPSTVDSVAEATQLQTNGSDGCEIVHHGPAVEVDNIMQEQSHQQVSPSMETASYSNSEQVGTEQEYPDPPVATSPGLPEDHIEALGTSHQSNARMSLPANLELKIFSLRKWLSRDLKARPPQAMKMRMQWMRRTLLKASNTGALGLKIQVLIQVAFSLCLVIHRQDLEGQNNSHPSPRSRQSVTSAIFILFTAAAALSRR